MVRLLLTSLSELFGPTEEFQSHNGAIAAVSNINRQHRSRLFQSHNGAIAACKIQSLDRCSAWFQSHNGAIAACETSVVTAIAPLVSIPQWCDCCKVGKQIAVNGDGSFNPTMVRLLPENND